MKEKLRADYMRVLEEFDRFAAILEDVVREADQAGVLGHLNDLRDVCNEVGKSWSGSWLGYHANVYYEGLQRPPVGARFSQEWGLKDVGFSDMGSRGDWCEYAEEEVARYIFSMASFDSEAEDLVDQVQEQADETFRRYHFEVLSCFETSISVATDALLKKVRDEIDNLSLKSDHYFIRGLTPSGRFFSRDSLAMSQGFRTPPHISVLSKVLATRSSIKCCETLAVLVRKVRSHLKRKSETQNGHEEMKKRNVFIGHGRSPLWRELKDFLENRLGLSWDEFNREPVAGIANTERIASMLDEAAFAFLVLTAEDETSEGKFNPRMNVVHEVGLFQGRLGFPKAIVLLEDGCEEFSNINGLGQIRFPKGDISARFEEIRKVLEREGLVK